MKNLLALSLLFLTAIAHAQTPFGAWERVFTAKSGEQLKSVVIFANGYQSISTYDATTGKFLGSNGGTWRLDRNTMTEKVEFDTQNSDRVGSESVFNIKLTDNTFEIVGTDMKMKRIDDGTPGKLNGAWLMSGRVVDGKTQSRDTDTPRKTMKILSGTRFQWIAYDTGTKKFMGTGGGTYTTIDGKYTEAIEFFSRDDSRVGMKLTFDYDLEDGNWRHSGSSSKGDPIDEVWSLRK